MGLVIFSREVATDKGVIRPSTKESTRNDTLIVPGTSGPNIARTQVDGAPLQTPSDETVTWG